MRTALQKLNRSGAGTERLSLDKDAGARTVSATILFIDIVGSTAQAAELGNRRWSERVARYFALVRGELRNYSGTEVHTSGDGFLVLFDAPTRAIRCASAIRNGVRDIEVQIRAGLHTGEFELVGSDVAGIAVHIAARVAAVAAPNEILVTNTVRELLVGSDVRFEDRGLHQLRGVPEEWRLYLAEIELDSESTTPVPKTTSLRRNRVALTIGAALMLLSAIVYGIRSRWLPMVPPMTQAGARSHSIRSVAILPLDNYSGDPNQEYFADGMTDELTTDLATISALRVISRGSVMQFKGEHRPPTPEIGRLLNVDAVFEGSIVRVGDRVRITAQLIDAPNDKHLWAKSFERDSRDILALQDELASATAKEINVELTPSERARLTNAPTVSPAAYDAYLKGRYFLARITDENLKAAIANFNEAIRIDPSLAAAYAGLADTFMWAGFNEGVFTSAEAMPLIRASAEKAPQLDDNSAEAHESLGGFKCVYEFDWEGGDREYDRALELNPNYAWGHDQYSGVLAWQGRLQEAWQHNERAMELDPLSPEPVINAIMALVWQGRFDKALEIARRTVELDPFLGHFAAGWTDVEAGRFNEAISELEQANGPDAPLWNAAYLGYAYGAAGRRDRALGVIEMFKQRSLHGYLPPFNLALVHVGMGDRGQALDDLGAALAARSQWVFFLKMDRVFDSLRREPRFIALLKKVHLYGERLPAPQADLSLVKSAYRKFLRSGLILKMTLKETRWTTVYCAWPVWIAGRMLLSPRTMGSPMPGSRILKWFGRIPTSA